MALHPGSRYPAPQPLSGAPFNNPNLKLVVLDSLLEEKLIDLGEPEDLARFVFGREVDLEKDGWDLSPELYDYLVRYPLTQEQVESVEELGFDGGSQIYPYAWYHWDGESDEFNVMTLAGIEHCVNLVRFNECTMVDNCDLAYLLPLKKLETVSLNECLHLNGEALLNMPALRSLACFQSSLSDPQILKTLAAKGLAIKIFE